MLEWGSIVAASMAVAMVLVFLFLGLYFVERKLHLLMWSIGWTMIAVAYGTRLLIFNNPSLILLELNFITTVASSWFVYRGVKHFLMEKPWKGWEYLLVLNSLLAFTVFLMDWPEAVYMIPASLLVGGLHFQSGTALLQTTKVASKIKDFVGGAFLMWACGLTAFPLLRNTSLSLVYIVVGSIGLLASLGLIAVFFQKVREELVEKEGTITYIAHHDNLTGLYNRTYFDKALQELDSAQNLPLSIIMGDLNGLKLCNDYFGHQAGDKLLIQAADILKSSCRKRDVVVRWGGDEFVIIACNTEYEEACLLTNRIKAEFISRFDSSMPLDISLGADTKENMSEEVYAVFRNAEGRMYTQKSAESAAFQDKLELLTSQFGNRGV